MPPPGREQVLRSLHISFLSIAKGLKLNSLLLVHVFCPALDVRCDNGISYFPVFEDTYDSVLLVFYQSQAIRQCRLNGGVLVHTELLTKSCVGRIVNAINPYQPVTGLYLDHDFRTGNAKHVSGLICQRKLWLLYTRII